MYQRHGHLNKIFVVMGQEIKKGDLIGTVGNGNGQYVNASHDHADFPIKKLASWTGYVFGWTKEEVQKAYSDPKPFRKICAPWFDHLGWGYLELATYGAKKCFHPGEDWNGKGGGDSDFGLPVYSAFDGKVIYCYDGKEKNGGWGKLLVIEEKKEIPKQDEVVPIPVKIIEAETIPEVPEVKEEKTEEVKSEVVPVDWNFLIGKIKELVNLIFNKKNNMQKKWYRSWTIWFNIAMLVIAVINELAKIIPISSEILGMITIIGNILLRVKTTMGIIFSEEIE